MSGTATAYSSHGEFTYDPETGHVLDTSKLDPEFGTMPTRVDVIEYIRYYGEKIKDGHQGDVLDICFWAEDGYVDSLDNDWRKDRVDEMVFDATVEIVCSPFPITKKEELQRIRAFRLAGHTKGGRLGPPRKYKGPSR